MLDAALKDESEEVRESAIESHLQTSTTTSEQQHQVHENDSQIKIIKRMEQKHDRIDWSEPLAAKHRR